MIDESKKHGEVERLRAEFEDLNSDYLKACADFDEVVAQRDTLRAQLAERDALLRQASEVGGLTEDWHEKVSALSASAEPCPDCKSSAPVGRDERAEFEKHFGNCTWGEDDYANEQRGWEARTALERKP